MYLKDSKTKFISFGVSGLLHVLCIFTYFFELFVILPLLYKDSSFLLQKQLHVAAGTFVLFSVLSSFWKFALVDSTVSDSFVSPTCTTTEWKYCDLCKLETPPRSHHCRVCHACVLVRDHHCVFGSNCVGYKSRRYFLLMNFYFWLALLYANYFNMMLMWNLYASLQYKLLLTITLPLFAWILGYADGQSLAIALFTSFCVVSFIYASAVFLFHLKNTIQGRTTHEVKKKLGFEYNLGLVRNLEHALGRNWKIAWISPFISSPLPGTGYVSEKCESESNHKKSS